MLAAFLITVLIATSSTATSHVSASAGGGSSAEASTHVVMKGNSSIEVNTNSESSDIRIATSSTATISHVSASSAGGSSAEASTRVVTKGSSSTVEVYTNVDGVEHTERQEWSGGGTLDLHVEAPQSTTSVHASTTVEKQKLIARVKALVHRILVFFGLSINDL